MDSESIIILYRLHHIIFLYYKHYILWILKASWKDDAEHSSPHHCCKCFSCLYGFLVVAVANNASRYYWWCWYEQQE